MRASVLSFQPNFFRYIAAVPILRPRIDFCLWAALAPITLDEEICDGSSGPWQGAPKRNLNHRLLEVIAIGVLQIVFVDPELYDEH